VLAPEQAARHNMRNVITNAVGGDARGVRPDVHKHVIAPGDLVLLCSDGLTEMVSEDEIAEQLARNETAPEAICRSLIDAANAAGGTDNITVVVTRFDATATASL
jgi:serine/threonine protein phosphatase PrpC